MPRRRPRGALHEGSIRFPSIKEFIRVEVKASPLADMLSDHAMESMAEEGEQALAKFVTRSDEVRGEAAALDCAKRWRRGGRHVRVARPPKGMDLNDLLMVRNPCFTGHAR